MGRNKLVELQENFKKLERCQVFRRPEDIESMINVVKKTSGGSRLVIAVANIDPYSKPQPSLMSDVVSNLRTTSPWKYVIKSDLTRSFLPDEPL